jgi:hypothetical protein
VLHLPNQDDVPEVQIRRRGIEADLHDQRPSGRLRSLELRSKLRGADDVYTAFRQYLHLLVDGHRVAL